MCVRNARVKELSRNRWEHGESTSNRVSVEKTNWKKEILEYASYIAFFVVFFGILFILLLLGGHY